LIKFQRTEMASFTLTPMTNPWKLHHGRLNQTPPHTPMVLRVLHQFRARLAWVRLVSYPISLISKVQVRKNKRMIINLQMLLLRLCILLNLKNRSRIFKINLIFLNKGCRQMRPNIRGSRLYNRKIRFWMKKLSRWKNLLLTRVIIVRNKMTFQWKI